jgi:hypothetical protein
LGTNPGGCVSLRSLHQTDIESSLERKCEASTLPRRSPTGQPVCDASRNHTG